MNGIKQLEIWTDGKHHGSGWFADYILVKDNKTDEEACFSIGNFLNKENGGVADDHLVLDKETNGTSCRNKENDMDTVETRQIQAVQSTNDSLSTTQYKKTYHVDTKTGLQHKTVNYICNTLTLSSGRRGFLGLSPTGTDADIYLRIHDKSGHISEPISLRRSTKHSNPFESGKTGNKKNIFQRILSQLSRIQIHLTSARKHLWKVFRNLNCITMELVMLMDGMSNT